MKPDLQMCEGADARIRVAMLHEPRMMRRNGRKFSSRIKVPVGCEGTDHHAQQLFSRIDA